MSALNLYLVRHAQPRSREEDPERHLSQQGWNDIRKVADFVASSADLGVDAILHSGKTRARETAQVLADALQPPEGIKQADGLDPLADPAIWADRVADARQNLMLVGHLPHLSRLAALLVCRDADVKIIDFSAAALVCLSRDANRNWSVCWMIVPEIWRGTRSLSG